MGEGKMSYEVGMRGRLRTTWGQVVDRDMSVWIEKGGCAGG